MQTGNNKMTRDRTLSRKAQNWGMDVMIGIGIFVLGLGLFFYIVDKKSDDDNVSELLRETEKMSQAMVAHLQQIVTLRVDFIVREESRRAAHPLCPNVKPINTASEK